MQSREITTALATWCRMGKKKKIGQVHIFGTHKSVYTFELCLHLAWNN